MRAVRVDATTFFMVDETYATHKRLAVASPTNKWQARHSNENAAVCSNSEIVGNAMQRKCGKMIPEKASRRNRGRQPRHADAMHSCRRLVQHFVFYYAQQWFAMVCVVR